eukprot:6214491-Pleurochrysis_carterae.AAC.8
MAPARTRARPRLLFDLVRFGAHSRVFPPRLDPHGRRRSCPGTPISQQLSSDTHTSSPSPHAIHHPRRLLLAC